MNELEICAVVGVEAQKTLKIKIDSAFCQAFLHFVKKMGAAQNTDTFEFFLDKMQTVCILSRKFKKCQYSAIKIQKVSVFCQFKVKKCLHSAQPPSIQKFVPAQQDSLRQK